MPFGAATFELVAKFKYLGLLFDGAASEHLMV